MLILALVISKGSWRHMTDGLVLQVLMWYFDRSIFLFKERMFKDINVKLGLLISSILSIIFDFLNMLGLSNTMSFATLIVG